MIAWKTAGTKLYQALPKEIFESWKECKPLEKSNVDLPFQDKSYKPFQK